MNPGHTLGLIAVIAAYTIVLGALLVFLGIMATKQKKLDRRRRELQDTKTR
jgi:hypothetical protein